jgi:DNA-binding NtrC family response regulator
MVLVVDDEESMRQFTVLALNRLGFIALARSDVDGAMEIVNTTPSLQVLLSDICLQSTTGPELVRQVLRNRPELKVVFMSGGFDNVAFRQTDPLLDKPFGLASLRVAIESVLNQSTTPFEPRITNERRRLVNGNGTRI